MSFYAFVGPMYSGKTAAALERLELHEHTNYSYQCFKPDKEVRDASVIRSRNGKEVSASKIKKIEDIFEFPKTDVYLVDEFHFFDDPKMVKEVFGTLLAKNVELIVSGLDLDYRGWQTSAYKAVQELQPDELSRRRAVCHKCKQYGAQFTQILDANGGVILGSLDEVVPEGSLPNITYEARCRDDFIRSDIGALATSYGVN